MRAISALSVRPAIEADAPAIGAVYVDSWRDTYPGLIPSSVLRRLDARQVAGRMRALIRAPRPRERILVAEHDSAIIGMASFGRSADRGLGFDSELFTLYVDPAHYGRGAGAALLDAVLEAEAARGAASLVVWVLAANPARFFYEARGGRLVATRELKQWGATLPSLGYGWSDLRPARGARTGRRAVRKS